MRIKQTREEYLLSRRRYREVHREENKLKGKIYRETHKKERADYRERNGEEIRRKKREKGGVKNATGERRVGDCFLCFRKNVALVCDHFHSPHPRAGEVRGWPCGRCNSGMGLLLDSAEMCENAAKYLRGFSMNGSLNAYVGAPVKITAGEFAGQKATIIGVMSSGVELVLYESILLDVIDLTFDGYVLDPEPRKKLEK